LVETSGRSSHQLPDLPNPGQNFKFSASQKLLWQHQLHVLNCRSASELSTGLTTDGEMV